MLDFNMSEMLVVAVVALLVIGPKDLPKAMRFIGQWVGKARGVARQFRSGFDTMVREAELAEMEKKWAAENERIMREHPPEPPPPPELSSPEAAPESAPSSAEDSPPAMTPQPDLRPDPPEPSPGDAERKPTA